jgi:hypothetical protein
MSIRAYKIIEIKTKDDPTFNMGQEFDWIEGIASYGTYNESGEIQQMEFETEQIRAAIAEKDRPKYQKDILRKILEEAGSDEYINYYCY